MKALSPVTAERIKPLKLSPRDRMRVELSKDGSKYNIDLFSVDENNIRWAPSSVAYTTFPQRIPTKKQLDGVSHWELDATDITSGIISCTWAPSQLIFSEEAKIVYQYHLATILNQEQIAEWTANYKLDGRLPDVELEIHPDYPLAPYQKVAAACAVVSDGFGFFMEPGTGKTACTISALCTKAKKHYAETGLAYRAIIVCPKNVRNNWLAEFEKFSTIEGNVTIMRGGRIRRTKQMIEAFTLEETTQFTALIVGYETLVKSWDILKLCRWNMAVCDEGHFFKNPNTQRYKFICELRDNSDMRLTLTGTPIANTPLDLFAQFEFMNKGGSGFGSWKAWKEFYGVYENQSGQGRLVGYQNMPFMQETLARKSYQITKKEALPNLPDKTYDRLDVEMTPHQRDIYEQAAEQLAVEIENDMNSSENKSLVINNILTKLLRLNQITSGFISWDPIQDLEEETTAPREIEFFSPNPKLDCIIEELKERPATSKTIIWCCWMPTIQRISERLTAEGIKHVMYRGKTKEAERDAAVKSFNEDFDTKVFLGNPGAGGIGLNLLGYKPETPDEYETNADWTVWFAQDWSALKRWQGEDRNHRRGTRVSVRNTDVCVPGSIDDQIRDRLLKKKKNATEVSDISEIIKAVLEGLGEDDE